MRRAISPRLATRIFLNIGYLAAHRPHAVAFQGVLLCPAFDRNAAVGNKKFFKHGYFRMGKCPVVRTSHSRIGGEPATCHGKTGNLWRSGQRQRPDHSITTKGWPYSTAWPFSQSTRVTVPDLSASISLRIFMASMMQMVSPSCTTLPTSTNDLAPGLDAR